MELSKKVSDLIAKAHAIPMGFIFPMKTLRDVGKVIGFAWGKRSKFILKLGLMLIVTCMP